MPSLRPRPPPPAGLGAARSVLLAPGLFSLSALQALLDGGACVFGRGQARAEGSSSLKVRTETPKDVLDGIAITSRVDSPARGRHTPSWRSA